jgi:AraC-like DNA-binding protein
MPIATRRPSANRLRIVRDRESGVEALHGEFTGHAYDPHQHEEWLVGVTLHGRQEFFCRGRRRLSTRGRVILIEPGEVHDGHAPDPAGFSYKMLYLPTAWLRRGLADAPGGDPGFRATLNDDPALAQAILSACDALATPHPRLTRDAALDAVVERLLPHLGRPLGGDRRDPGVARRAREAIIDRLDENMGADELARAAGAADRFQLARVFRDVYGTSPHAYAVQSRLARARALLRAGASPGDVAADCGFADQSHFGRWFRRAYGLTPSAYRFARAQTF